MPEIDLSSMAADLAVITDAVERYGDRVTDLVLVELPHLDPEGRHDDLLSALHEAERSLRVALRSLGRAHRLAAQP